MSATEEAPYSPQWLGLREDADAAARAADLIEPLRARLAGRGVPVIRDLGCGTGSMGRWLAARLAGPQHWIMHDRDPELLTYAATTMARTAADGAEVTVTTEHRDITGLTAAELDGTALVTASALLDLLTLDEVDALAVACVNAGAPALLTLSVVGLVRLDPVEDLDAVIVDAFNAHQRRETQGRRLLGPDAPDAAAQAFTRHGASVELRDTPWRLGPDQRDLTARWLRGWVGAACEEQPDLHAKAQDYLRRRLDAAAAGELSVEVGHRDLLALPDRTPA